MDHNESNHSHQNKPATENQSAQQRKLENALAVLVVFKNEIYNAVMAGDVARMALLRSAELEFGDWVDAGMGLPPLSKSTLLIVNQLWKLANEDKVSPPQTNLPVQPAPIATPVAIPIIDEDPALEGEYQAALDQFDQGNLLVAIQGFEKLQLKAQGKIARLTLEKLNEAKVALEQSTQSLIRSAQNIESQFPENLDKQRDAWNKVIQFNPRCQEARQALNTLTELSIQQELEHDLSRIPERVQTAEKNQNLPELNSLFGQLEGWIKRGEKNELPESSFAKVRALHSEILEIRTNIRSKLGIASTIVVQKQFGKAYELARSYFEMGTPIMVDEAGVMGAPGAEIATSDFFREIRKKFLVQLRNKVSERLDQAAAEMKSTPDVAEVTIQDALTLLNDPVLTLDDLDELKPELEKVKKDLEAAQAQRKKFDLAKEKILVSQRQDRSPKECYNLLVEAKELYPDYPSLDRYIDQARDNRSAELSHSLKGVIIDANRAVGADDFEKALNILRLARADVLKEIPQPKPDSLLGEQLASLDNEEKSIALHEKNFRLMLEILKSVNEYINLHTTQNDPNALEVAHLTLKNLPEEYRFHYKVIQAQDRLAIHQGDQKNWEDGQHEYQLKNWEMAIKYLEKIKPNFLLKAEADKTFKRARAARIATLAEDDDNQKKWSAALQKYKEALIIFAESGHDESTSMLFQTCQSRIPELEIIDKNDKVVLEEFQKMKAEIKTARSIFESRQNSGSPRDKVDPITGLKDAIEKLEILFNKKSNYSEDIHKELMNARLLWRDAYINGMEAASNFSDLEILSRARENAQQLRSAGLLYEPKHQLLERELESKWLDKEYINLLDAVEYSNTVESWRKIETNRQNRFKLEDDVEKSREFKSEYRDAVYHRVESEISQILTKRQTESAAQQQENILLAQDYLKGEMEHSQIVSTDRRLIEHLIRMYWDTNRWDEAVKTAELFSKNLSNSDGRELAFDWQNLTTAAAYLADDNLDQANISFSKLINTKTITEQKTILLKKTLDRLMKLAKTYEESQVESDLLKAAKLYALAFRIKSDGTEIGKAVNEEVKQKLIQLGSKLKSSISSRCQEAKNLRLGGRQLSIAIKEADEIKEGLRAIEEIAKLVNVKSTDNAGNLTEDDQVRIGDALQSLTDLRERWDKIDRNLSAFDKEITKALSNPLPMDLDGRGGGWDFKQTQQFLNDSNQVILRMPADKRAEITTLIQNNQAKLSNFERTATDLTACIHDLREAIYLEEFEKAIQSANALHTKWQNACRQNSNWNGLEVLTPHKYLGSDDLIFLPNEHAEQAKKQQEDYIRRKNWADDIEGYWKNVQTHSMNLGKPLPRIKQTMELAQIISICEKAKLDCDEFCKRLSRCPHGEGLSKKAQEDYVQKSIEYRNANVCDDGGLRDQIVNLKDEAIKEKEKLEPHLARLRVAYNNLVKMAGGNPPTKDVPKDTKEVTERDLRNCQEIDPCNRELLEREYYIKRVTVKIKA